MAAPGLGLASSVAAVGLENSSVRFDAARLERGKMFGSDGKRDTARVDADGGAAVSRISQEFHDITEVAGQMSTASSSAVLQNIERDASCPNRRPLTSTSCTLALALHRLLFRRGLGCRVLAAQLQDVVADRRSSSTARLRPAATGITTCARNAEHVLDSSTRQALGGGARRALAAFEYAATSFSFIFAARRLRRRWRGC